MMMMMISNFFPCFQNFMINRENLIKIGRAGGNTSNRENPDQIRRVGMSESGSDSVVAESFILAF